MHLLVNLVIFGASMAIVWFFAGIVIDAVSRIARRFCNTGFFTAFFLLGFLTSVSEASVALNAGLAGVPGVSIGNLVGASLVLLLFVVPLLAVAGNAVSLNDIVSKRSLIIILCTIALPAILVIDGNVTKTEGLLALLAYGTVAYSLFRNRIPIQACDITEERQRGGMRGLGADILRVVIGAIAIFAAAYFLVEQAVYFAGLLAIPASLIGLVLLSIGTNVPEIVIAIRSVTRKQADIALGDYLGSASMNTALFALLALGTGTFAIEASEFVLTAPLLVSGLALFYFFVRSNNKLTRHEGLALLLLYGLFVALQMLNVVRLT